MANFRMAYRARKSPAASINRGVAVPVAKAFRGDRESWSAAHAYSVAALRACGWNGVEDEIEAVDMGGHRFRVLGHDQVGRAEPLGIVALAGGGAEHIDLGAHRGGDLDAHMAEPANPDHADLLARRFVSQAAFDAKENAFRSAQARLEQARAQSQISGNQAAYGTLAAETDGVITAVLADTGQVVSPGQAVFRLARPEEKEVAIAIQ